VEEDAVSDPHLYFTSVSMTDAVFGDAAGQIPWRSHQGNQYLLITCRNGYVHFTPMPSRAAASYARAFAMAIEWWTAHGGRPNPLKLDNELSQEVVDLIQKQCQVSLQTAPPNDHRTNRAERAIGTAKPHILSTLASAPPACPIFLWEDFLPQLEITCNILHPYALNRLFVISFIFVVSSVTLQIYT